MTLLEHRSSTPDGRRPTARPRLVGTYDYQNAGGELRFQVCRYEPKDFRQRRPDGNGGWTWETKGIEKVLFRLPEIIRDVQNRKFIFICEGEKDVLAMVQRGLSATCNPGGAGKWLNSYTETLRSADVVIVADKDTAGREHAQLVAGKLQGIAKAVRVLELPDVEDKPVKDAFDFFAAGGDAEQIAGLVDAAPMWSQGTAKVPSESLSSTTTKQQPLVSLRTAYNAYGVYPGYMCKGGWLREEELIEKCTCTKRGTSRPKLFLLGRGILTLEKDNGGKLSGGDLHRIFEAWYGPSLPSLNPDESKQDYFEKFLEAVDCAKQPLGETALNIAWSKSLSEPMPEVATNFRSPTTQKLVAFCWQLQTLSSTGKFFLGCRDAGKLLGVSHVRAADLLRGLVGKKVLGLICVGVVKPNGESMASEYRFTDNPKTIEV